MRRITLKHGPSTIETLSPNSGNEMSPSCFSRPKLSDSSDSVTDEDGTGYRSPYVSLQQQYQGSTSPAGQGRSVREYEEQMTTLRKENFNLKLRLYFLEESIPGYQQQHVNGSSEGQEPLLKQLIDSKVEKEILRKEIQEKQDLLKDAAHAMTQMEKTQIDNEAKFLAEIEELRQKIQYLEMEHDHDKTNNGEYMNELLGRSDLSDSMNTLQKIRELEGLLKQTDERNYELQIQITKLDEILAHRDETIKEYEEKVKELVFQNAELLESLENKEKEVSNAERIIRSIRQSNADLKEDNDSLLDALKGTQENFRKELANMKIYEKQMRDQQEALSQMQSTISMKTANTTRLLERIQDYEKMVTKMNFERNLAKRENRFFRAIIHKLQNQNECYTIQQEEIYHKISTDFDKKLAIDGINPRHFDFKNYRDFNGDFQGEYKLKQKFCVNICNNAAKFCHGSSSHDEYVGEGCGPANCNGDVVGAAYLSSYHQGRSRRLMHPGSGDNENELEATEVPIRYTFSDGSVFATGGMGMGAGGGGPSNSNSSTSLQANFSSSSLFLGNREEVFMQDQRHQQPTRKKYSPVDGIRYVCSKFGNYH